jgi:hypothetical protein
MTKPAIQFHHERISTDSVDWSDRTFSVRLGRDNGDLKRSIGRCGLLSPPLLLSGRSAGGMTVVCGFGRLEAIRDLGVPACDARVSADSVEPAEGLTIAIEENAGGRGFNAAEQAVAVGKLTDFGVPSREIISCFLPLLGLRPDCFTLERFLHLSALDADALLALAAGRLSEEAACCLSPLEPGDRRCLLRLLCTALPFGKNKQIELVESVLAVTTRDGISVNDLFESSGIGHLIDADDPDPFLRAAEVRHIVRKQRYPRLSAWDERVRAFRLSRPPSCFRLEPPPNLEGGKMQAEFSFASRREFHDCLRQLKEFGSSQGLEKALELLRG